MIGGSTIGDLLEWTSLPIFGVRRLASDDQEAFGDSCKGVQLALEVFLVLGSASVALGQDSIISFFHVYLLFIM